MLVFDGTFDHMNSKLPVGQFTKAPLRKTNKTYWKATFEEAKAYVTGLKHADE